MLNSNLGCWADNKDAIHGRIHMWEWICWDGMEAGEM